MINEDNFAANEQPNENSTTQEQPTPAVQETKTVDSAEMPDTTEAVTEQPEVPAAEVMPQQEENTAAGGEVSALELAEEPVPTMEEPVFEQQVPETAASAAENNAQGMPFGYVPPVNVQYVPQQPIPQQVQYGWAPGFTPPQSNPVYPQYQYGQPVQQPVQGQYVPPMPPQGQPVNVPPQYYQPPVQQGYYYAPPYGYPVPPVPPKKKMSTGLKVFIWVAAILVGISVIGGIVFLASSVVNRQQYSYSYTLPKDNGGDYNKNDEVPDFDDGVEMPEADETPVLPDVDVTPNNDGITIKQKPEGDELSAQEVYDKVVKSTVTVAVTLNKNGAEQNSTGTGIIATSDGYIITNSHVVLNSKSSVVQITTYDGQQYEAVVVGMDRSTDLAVLKTNDYGFTPAEFGDSTQLVIGESVVAIGNPGGEKFSGSMTGGYVSGLNREVGRYSASGMTYIQTDAAINPGNSGGPLVNMYGQVVGINSSKIITDGYEGMGFAIPTTNAKSVIDALLAGGYVEGRTRLGITGTEISEMQAAIYGMPRGFMIAAIDDESAFTGTAAQVGDIITAIDGEVVTGLTDISNLLTRYSPGDTIKVTLNRNGTELEVEAVLLEDKGETQK